jgi:copper chaperone CopZ
MIYMKKIFLIIAIAVSLSVEAQVSSVSLQASGLTCSMCSNAINKALKTLDFISGVDADIKTYTFEISFKTNSIVDFDMIRKKVESAGFTVCAFYANLHFSNVEIKADEPVVIAGRTFLFVNTKDKILNGDRKIKIMDKGFVSAKEYKRNTYPVLSPQTYHITL